MKTKLLLLVPLLLCACSGVADTKPSYVAEQNPLQKDIHRNVLTDEYEIYPIPHKITYSNTSLTMQDQIDLKYSTHIDQETITRAINVLSMKDVRIYKNASSISGSSTKIELKTFEDVTLESKYTYLEDKYDSYILDVNSQGISIIGKDSDATFYGLASLEYIFKQTQRTVRGLVIEDYADLKYRGFIEGFYGDPWSAEDREALMRVGMMVKTNAYIYAPKDDAYHSAIWRKLYDAKELARLKEQIDEGRRTKTKFVWAVHPFINDPLKESTYDEDMEQLLAKLEQVYQAGCRQFMISGDDAIIPGCLNPDGTLTPDYKERNEEYAKVQNRCLNEVAAWLKAKGDCGNLAFVGGAYCYQAEAALSCFNLEYYYRGLVYGDDGNIPGCTTMLDDTIDLMWTGNQICSTLSDGKLDEFISYAGRKPFIWMNWPVNDMAPGLVRIGPAEIFDVAYQDSEDAQICSMVTNLMLEVESNKFAVFGTGDYCWNTRDFNAAKSFKDSIKYLEPNTPDSFFEISEHLRNLFAKFSGRYFDEATELKGLIEQFETQYEAGDAADAVDELKTYFNKLIYSCDDFVQNGANRKLIKELKQWVNSIRYGALCANEYLKVFDDGNARSQSMYHKKQGSILYELFAHQTIKSPNAATYNIKYVDVTPGVTVLEPFLKRLDELTGQVVSLTGVQIQLDYDTEGLGPDTGVAYQGVDGKFDYMIDGDMDTRAYFLFKDWLYMFKFDLIFDYGSTQTVSSIDLIQGETDRIWCWIEYSMDGVNWTRIPYHSVANEEFDFLTDNNGLIDGEVSYGQYRAKANTHIEFAEPFEARYIKLKNYHTNCRVLIYEFMLNGAAPVPKDIITFNGLTLKDGEDINALLTNNPVSFESYNEGEFVLDYDLGEQKQITDVDFEMDSVKCLSEYDICYSEDGYNYKLYQPGDSVKGRYVRIYSNHPTNKELTINKLEVSYA